MALTEYMVAFRGWIKVKVDKSDITEDECAEDIATNLAVNELQFKGIDDYDILEAVEQ